jgi:hypothetical protein
MPGQRLTAWLRPLLTLAALAGVLSRAPGGGGKGSPSSTGSNPSVALAVLPAAPTVYSGTPVTLTVSGGQGPFALFSSDQSVLAVPVSTDGSFLIAPGVVSTDTTVQITVRDNRGTILTIPVLVKAGLLVNTMTLKADNFLPACPNDRILSSSPTDDIGSTWICSGQTGTVGVRLQNVVGGGLSGRPIQFDVIQGDFQIFTNAAGQPETFGLTYTVPSDQNGNAVVRIRANTDAPQQLVVVQAKDVMSGSFVRGIFVVQQVVAGGANQLQISPDTITITGPDTLTCSANVPASFFIFGGQPPYTISNPFPQALTLQQSFVQNAGGGFTVITKGVCVTPATLTIRDAAGHTTTVTLNNNPGTTPPGTSTLPAAIVVTPSASSLPVLACNTSTNVVAVGGGTITTTGNTQTTTPATNFTVATDRPDILAITASAGSVAAPGSPIKLQRLPATTVTVGGTDPAVVHLFISDTGQTQTLDIRVANVCP